MSFRQPPPQSLSRVQSVFARTPQVVVTLAIWTEIEDSLKKNKKKWPPTNPNTHPYSLPLPLKLHSNGLDGVF